MALANRKTWLRYPCYRVRSASGGSASPALTSAKTSFRRRCARAAPYARQDFAERAAYELVLQAYEWFGVEASAVPFVDQERRVLDAAALEAHLKGSNVAALAAP